MEDPTDIFPKSTNNETTTSPASPTPKPKKKKSITKKKKRSNPKKKSHIKSESTSPSKSKKKKKTNKRKKRKNKIKPSNILIKEKITDTQQIHKLLNGITNDENKSNNNNTNENINILPTTYTSPIHSFNTMAHTTATVHDTSNIDIEKIINDKNNNIKAPSPLEAIKQHKLQKIKQQKTKHISDKNNSKKHSKKSVNESLISNRTDAEITNDDTSINLSYFQNYFDRSVNMPNEMNILLDRIENNLMFIFNDTFLNKSIRTKKIYNLCITLHRSFIEYKLSFLLPVCKHKLIELDTMFLQIIKWFNRFKRYHRSPEILKYKQQINKLKTNVDILITNIESNCSIILYSTIRAKQLFLEFHKNTKLLIFWMDLFDINEFEFVELSWVDFVHNIRQNKSFKKFKKFKSQAMINILTENYEVLTIKEFLKYVLEYESVGGWLNDMYSYISTEIANPHKKNKHNNTLDNKSILELTDTIQDMIKMTIKNEMNSKFNELSSRFGQLEQSLTMNKDNKMEHQMDGNDDSDDTLNDVATFEHVTSNGTVILHHNSGSSVYSHDTHNSSSSDDGMDQKHIQLQTETNNDQTHEVPESKVVGLEDENRLLKNEIKELKGKVKDYELRLNGVTMKSKQVFSLQTKVNYYEKFATLMKKRCYSLHKQLNQDFTQLTMWYNTVNLKNNMDETQHNKLLKIQNLFNEYLNDNSINDNESINEIQMLFKDVLESNGKNVKLNKKSDVMWQRMRNSLQHGTSEILSIHNQLNDNFITNDNISSPLSPLLPSLNNRPQSAKLFAKKLHKRQKTFSVATLKQMNTQMNRNTERINNKIGKVHRTRTYSAHDLAQLKFVPFDGGKENTSFDIYTNKPKKKKRVSFAFKPPNLESIKVRNVKVISNVKKHTSPISPLVTLNDMPVYVNKGTLNRKRRHSDGNINDLNKSSNEWVHEIHKLFENESELNDDTINKIRNELLKEREINKHFKRRHSLCSVSDNGKGKGGNNNNENEYVLNDSITDETKANDLFNEKPINYNNFTTRNRATSAGNKAPLIGLYGDQEFSDDDLIKMRQTHFRNHSTIASISKQNKNSIGKIKIRKRKHKRYKTSLTNINRSLLSPNWAANIALNTVTDDVNITYDQSDATGDGSASDVMSTLSNIDYTFMLDELEDRDSDNSNSSSNKAYVNIYGDNKEEEEQESDNNILLHNRRRSYRFPYENKVHNKINSIIDPFDLLDDKMLLELKNESEQLKAYEFEMKSKLITMLREMDLMGEGKLDLADFASGIMNIVNDYDDIMEDAELIFETLQDKQDDMGSIKIEIIVDAIVNNKNNDGAAKNIKQQIMVGLKLNEKYENMNSPQHNNINMEDMPFLYVKPKEVDPNEMPYKPIYQTSTGIQKIKS